MVTVSVCALAAMAVRNAMVKSIVFIFLGFR
jgi:hypothetical protein